MSIFTKILGAVLVTGSLVAGMGNAFAYDRHVEIINKTDSPIVNFYASNVGTNDWQEDMFGNGVLNPDHEVNVNFNDGSGYCKFDFRAVFADGTVLVQQNVNVCEIPAFTYHM